MAGKAKQRLVHINEGIVRLVIIDNIRRPPREPGRFTADFYTAQGEYADSFGNDDQSVTLEEFAAKACYAWKQTLDEAKKAANPLKAQSGQTNMRGV